MQRQAGKEDKKIKNQKTRLRNNDIFGKSIENSMIKVDIKIVTTKKQYLQWLFRQTFKREKQLCNGVKIAIEKENYELDFNKSIHIGTSISGLSKVLMQNFHYDYIKSKYEDKPKCC